MKITFALLVSLTMLFGPGVVAQAPIKLIKAEYPTHPFGTEENGCGKVYMQLWDAEKQWHPASCREIAERLSKERDVRSVSYIEEPSPVDMLTYQQYRDYFEISYADFLAAQKNCRKLLEEGYAHPDILKQCKETVKGIVPYGLHLKGESK